MVILLVAFFFFLFSFLVLFQVLGWFTGYSIAGIGVLAGGWMVGVEMRRDGFDIDDGRRRKGTPYLSELFLEM